MKLQKLILLTVYFVSVLGLSVFFTITHSVNAAMIGDGNADGVVDGRDYIVWVSHYGTNVSGPINGDFNNDSQVNGQDYIQWLINYGKRDTSPTSGIDPTPPTFTNLLTNPGFESGNNGQWSGGSSSVNTAFKHTGNYSLKVTGWDELSQTVAVKSGKQYTFSGWFMYTGPLGEGYGQTRFEADYNVLTNYHENMELNKWYKLAITFTASGSSTTLKLGLWGPKNTANLYYDDLSLFENPVNSPPILAPQANVISGQAPLEVRFSANEQDYDGAVSSLRWNFGDGGEETVSSPSHTYISAGTFPVSVTAVDNLGISVTKNLSIMVTDTNSPVTSITAPTTNSTLVTPSSYISLTGTSRVTSGQISKVVWDNINTDEVGNIPITSNTTVNWSTGNINLKPGKNEVLITSTSSNGTTSTDRIIVNRQVSGPVIKNISVNTTSPRMYEKYELTFDLETVAEQYMFMYDPNPPPGVNIYSGVSVEGIVTKPDGTQATQPGFYLDEVIKNGSDYTNTGIRHWKIRIAPLQTGTYQVAIRVTDKSGTVTSSPQTFIAQPAVKDGFVQTSVSDPRFFQYSSGKIYWPLGMTWGGGGGNVLTSDGIDLSNSVLNYDRYWMGGVGAYSSRWTRWFSTNFPDWGNEGPEPNMIYTEHYPGHELSQPLYAGKGYRIEIGWLQAAKTLLKRSTTYQIKLRLKTVGITGSGSNAGLVVKHHTFWSINDQPYTEIASRASMIPPITGTHDWFTIINRYTTPSTLSDVDVKDTNFSIYLQNITAGAAYIDELSIREVKADGSLGGEIIASSLADQHTYVDQRPMQYLEEEVIAGEINDVHVRFVVHDKNDWIQNHLSASTGQFVKVGDGYYQPENTKATWILKQWWRYLVGRMGYSTGLFGWELNNEGPPDDGTGIHARTTAIFTKWVHTLDMHPHLNGTSFWCCWKPTFWGDKTKYPYLDIGDIHHYDSFPDMVDMHLDDAIAVMNDNIKRPVVMGERGFVDQDGTTYYTQLKSKNKGTWYHDMLWSQLHTSTLYEIGYWHPEHVVGWSRENHSRLLLVH